MDKGTLRGCPINDTYSINLTKHSIESYNKSFTSEGLVTRTISHTLECDKTLTLTAALCSLKVCLGVVQGLLPQVSHTWTRQSLPPLAR